MNAPAATLAPVQFVLEPPTPLTGMSPVVPMQVVIPGGDSPNPATGGSILPPLRSAIGPVYGARTVPTPLRFAGAAAPSIAIECEDLLDDQARLKRVQDAEVCTALMVQRMGQLWVRQQRFQARMNRAWDAAHQGAAIAQVPSRPAALLISLRPVVSA